MKKRNKFILAALALILACGAIVLTSSASEKNKEAIPTCCKKIEKKCSEPGKKNSSGELIMDNFSRQFISVFFSTR